MKIFCEVTWLYKCYRTYWKKPGFASTLGILSFGNHVH